LGPYLMAPAWWIHDVGIAYRVALGWGALWFSVAAFPAYAIARRIGVRPSGALLAAALALLVPDAAFTTNLLSEPYAYPVFLATVLVAIEAIAQPSFKRQASVLVLCAALCLLRVQFVVVPSVYLLAALACTRFSLRRFARDQRFALG